MNLPHPDLAKCHSFVVCHLSDEQKRKAQSTRVMPFITISRQTGAGARSLGKQLQVLLDKEFPLADSQWAVFDKNLVQTAMKAHGLPERFARYLPEGHVSEISSMIGELLGLHPPIWELNKDVYETLIHMANLGGVVLVGRGSHVVTRKMGNGLHLRLVGSVDRRVQRAADYYRITLEEAREFIEQEDKARRLWIRENFAEDINDPGCYDLSINTDSIHVDDAASLVLSLMKKRFPLAATG